MSKLNQAFRAMRKQGLFARQSYWCCSSCAGYAAGEICREKAEAGKPYKGVVFYHQQDAENKRDGDDFYLAYSDTGVDGSLTIEQVGELARSVLEECGIETEWDGNPNVRILIKNNSL